MMEQMIEEYRQTLRALYERRELLAQEMGEKGRRLRVLDEEIDEMEEALMHMRRYAAL